MGRNHPLRFSEGGNRVGLHRVSFNAFALLCNTEDQAKNLKQLRVSYPTP